MARHEGMEVARNLDKRTLNAWIGHPHITVCPNIPGETFEQKIQKALDSVHKTVGLEIKKNRYEKFIIDERTSCFIQPSSPSNSRSNFPISRRSSWRRTRSGLRTRSRREARTTPSPTSASIVADRTRLVTTSRKLGSLSPPSNT